MIPHRDVSRTTSRAHRQEKAMAHQHVSSAAPARTAAARAAHLLLFATVALGVGLYGLSSMAQTDSTVKVASAGIASDIGFYLALDKGYFHDEGLDVELTQMANSPQMIGPLGR